MDFQTLLRLCTDIARFLFSTLHLLLTRILPLIAMLLGSLLLELLRFFASFLFPRPGFSIEALFLKRNRAPVLRQGQSETAMAQYESPPSAPPYRDALQDFYEDGASAIQEEAILISNGLDAHLQEERFEDCFDADFIKEQQLLLSQYEDIKRRVRTPANGDRHEADVNMREAEGGDRSQQSAEEEVGNFEQEFGAPGAMQAPRSPESQASLFPSDLPATLDRVVQAAVAAEDDTVRSRRTSSSTQRSLPPTLSNIQKALHDMRNIAEDEEGFHGSDVAPSFSQAHRHPTMPLNAPARTSSYDEFVNKFTQHFKLDRN